MNKTVYRLTMTAKSPLSIGSGANENTDRDIILDSLSRPLIPATSIAGVLRSSLIREKVKIGTIDYPLDHVLFGFIPTEKVPDKKKDAPEYKTFPSLIRIYDATSTSDDPERNDYFVTVRDCVKLQNKVGVDGNKFDLEAVEPGASFVGFIELLDGAEPYKEKLEAALAAVDAGLLRFGSKTTRGYGAVTLTVDCRKFTDVPTWLDFDMFDPNCWCAQDRIALPQIADSRKWTVELKSCGGLSIRSYTTDVSTPNENMPDYRTLTLHDNTPVITGTTWAGAFSDRFCSFAGEEKTEALFGYVIPKTGETQKSQIVFSESRLTGGVFKKISRNSIDRFSGATKERALYTDSTYYYGTTTLEITFRREPTAEERQLLGVCLADLHNGFLSVGGLTAIGRGLFEITSLTVDGATLKENITANTILDTVTGGAEK